MSRPVTDALTTNETLFFRDQAQYDALKATIVPALVAERKANRFLRFWSAACSSGQESYSLVMQLLEAGLGDWAIEVLGTDISEHIVARARAGRFMQIEVNRGLPVTHLLRYFVQHGLDWQLKDVVRNRVRPRTRATARLAEFLSEIDHADLGALSDRAIYNDVAALGLSIFDLPGRRAEQLRADWGPLLGYVGGAG